MTDAIPAMHYSIIAHKIAILDFLTFLLASFYTQVLGMGRANGFSI